MLIPRRSLNVFAKTWLSPHKRSVEKWIPYIHLFVQMMYIHLFDSPCVQYISHIMYPTFIRSAGMLTCMRTLVPIGFQSYRCLSSRSMKGRIKIILCKRLELQFLSEFCQAFRNDTLYKDLIWFLLVFKLIAQRSRPLSGEGHFCLSAQ